MEPKLPRLSKSLSTKSSNQLWNRLSLRARLLLPLAAMIVGVVIALFQALTQIQEVTLTFIPKILVILVVTAATGSFVGSQIMAFATETYGHIAKGF